MNKEKVDALLTWSKRKQNAKEAYKFLEEHNSIKLSGYNKEGIIGFAHSTFLNDEVIQLLKTHFKDEMDRIDKEIEAL